MHVSILKGYASSPASFVRQLPELLTESVGWRLVDTISGTLLQQDLVFLATVSGVTSSGTGVLEHFCIRAAGFDDHVCLYGYDSCAVVSGTTTYSGEIHSPAVSRVFCPPGEFKFWAFADDKHLKFVLEEPSSGMHYHGYTGLIDSFYAIDHDPVPLLVFATVSGSRSLEDEQSPLMRLHSGSVGPYKTWVPYSSSFGSSVRNAACGGMAPILYTTDSVGHEIRGIPRGILKIPDSTAGLGSEYVLSSGIYFSFLGSGDTTNSYMYGAVRHGAYLSGCPGCR